MTGQAQAALVLLLGCAGWLLAGDGVQNRLGRLRSPSSQRPSLGRPRVALGTLACALAVVAAAFIALWAVAIVVASATVAWVTRQHARAAVVRREEADVAGSASTISLLLAAGRIPTEAVLESALDHPCLAAAATAVRVGGDVADGLEASSRVEGRQGLATVAAAWRVCEEVGAPVAQVMAEVVEALRGDRELADIVDAELSAARASGRVMALLPLGAIGLGSVVGADPLGFLLGDFTGQLLLVAGVGLAAVGVVWNERIARPPGPSGRGGGR